MDTSEQYIKMRLAAIPNLGMGIPMGFSINWQSEVVLIDEKGDWYYSTKDEAVQLERQDQLQEMVSDNINYTIQIQGFGEMLEFLGRQSWEQLWLAFVMKEKHNKVWDGEEWIILKQ